jgi:NAD(P)-dependent dehydrogenase (short-subunit alcohol dehydrogenase family)
MANAKPWTADDMPELSGQTIIVTGGNSGIGYEAALQFARKNAHVILGCRSVEKGNAAASQIVASHPGAMVEVMELDLSSLDSVRNFARTFHDSHRALNALVNNAGVMAIPYRRTDDGFEMQFGTNHLGHFALTGLLLDALLGCAGARVVNVSSGAHRMGRIRFDDLQSQNGYYKWLAYGQSKLANLLFTFELQRRADAAGAKLLAVACHPGYAATNLQGAGPRMLGSSGMESFWKMMNSTFAQTGARGALPTLYATTSPDVAGGDYIGPDGFAEMWGNPTKVKCSTAAKDAAVAAQLWEVSEQLTKVHFSFQATEEARV